MNITKAQTNLKFSAVKELIAINHIQNKSFCLHNVCVLCIFILCI